MQVDSDAGGTSLARLPSKRMAATVLFTDPAGRVLIVEPTYKPRWELPGGVVEAGESPRVAAQREIAEELGLACEPGPLLAVDYVPASADRTEGVITVFDGGVLDASVALRLPAAELASYAFVEPGRLGEYLPALLARRAVAALAARRERLTVYLEDGFSADVRLVTT